MNVGRILASLWLAAISALCVAIMGIPNFPAPKPGQAWFLVLGTAISSSYLKFWRGYNKAIWLVILMALLFVPIGVVSRGFGGVDMLAFIFHFQFGTKGATIAGLEDEIVAVVISVVLFAIATLGLNTVVNRQIVFTISMAAVLLVANPAVRFLGTMALEGQVRSGLGAELRDPSIVIAPNATPDILVVYLEGFERRYLDAALFPDTAPILETATNPSIDLTDIRQVAGTGWSVAGVVASQCGVPPLPNGLVFQDGFEHQADFLISRYCLSDALKDLGYRNEFVVGSEIEFGGLGNFLSSHGYDHVTSIDTIRNLVPEKVFDAAVVDWTLDDQLTFDAALGRQQLMLEVDTPFLLVVETFSLHGRLSVVSRQCSDDGKAFFEANLQFAATCAANDFASFLASFREAQGDRPVRIVVMSDHLSHFDGVEFGLPQDGRRNTVRFLTADGVEQTIHRPGTMLDVYPTMLDWLGFLDGSPRAGLGVSLFSTEQTLMETYGEEFLNDAFSRDADLASAIWAN